MSTYDAARGMVRFSSDLTFGSGSDQVKSEAVNAISQLAGVLGPLVQVVSPLLFGQRVSARATREASG